MVVYFRSILTLLYNYRFEHMCLLIKTGEQCDPRASSFKSSSLLLSIIRHTRYAVMITKERHTKIVKFMTPGQRFDQCRILDTQITFKSLEHRLLRLYQFQSSPKMIERWDDKILQFMYLSLIHDAVIFKGPQYICVCFAVSVECIYITMHNNFTVRISNFKKAT